MTLEPRPKVSHRLASALLLSLLFLAVYGVTNAAAARRADVGMWFHDWELSIPLIPIMIVPYLSIDLFFAGAPFLCTSGAELRAHNRRTTLAILAAGACFLLMPLTTGYQRTVPEGWTAPLFRLLHGFDQPHNLFPSLHITLQAILASLYAKHTRGLARAASNVWFSLVAVSTVFTHQHHVVDVFGGLLLAAVCFYAFPSGHEPGSPHRNCAVGIRYGIAGVGCGVVAALLPQPWAWLLVWPGVSLTLVASACLWFGPGIYRKHRGRIPPASKVLLGPAILGQWLSLAWYKRSNPRWHPILPNVWIGFRLTGREAVLAVQQGVTATVDLTAEFSEAAPLRSGNYLNLQALDLTALSATQLNEAADFIHEHSQRGIVYVHCKVGFSRSASAIGAYLIKYGHCSTVYGALALLRRRRPGIVIRPEAIASLNEFVSQQRSGAIVANTQG